MPRKADHAHRCGLGDPVLGVPVSGAHRAISRLLNAVGINMMGRDYIWSLAKPYYQFSPTFIGLGFEAVDAMVTRFYEIGLIDVAYPLHNDILKVFVELGFPGLCFWCAFLYLILPWFWIKRYGPEAGILYFAILNPLSMTYLTDNTAFYFWCTMGLRMIPLAVCCFAKPTKDPAVPKQTWQPPPAQEVQRRIRAQYRRKDVLHDPHPAVGQQHGPGRHRVDADELLPASGPHAVPVRFSGQQEKARLF